jgi:hypothetical protein
LYAKIVGVAVVGTIVVVGATVGTAVVGTVVGAADAVGSGDQASAFGNAGSMNQPLLQGASLPSPQLAS